MPPKAGPATVKKGTASAVKPSSTDDAVSGAPEPDEAADDTTTEQPEAAPEAKDEADAAESEAEGKSADVKVELNPDQRAQDEIRKMYPADTDLWFGAVKGLWFGLPKITGITPTRQWLRQIYNLTQYAQTFEWMALAKVPMALQARTDALTDEEYDAMFNAWFQDAEVTLPK